MNMISSWWVLGWSLLSWPVMSLCFHCSPPSRQALGPIQKRSSPFGSCSIGWGEKEEMLWGFEEQWGTFQPLPSAGLFSHGSSRGLCSCSLFWWEDAFVLNQDEEQLKCGCLTAFGPGRSASSEGSMSSAGGVMLLLKTQWQKKEDLPGSW